MFSAGFTDEQNEKIKKVLLSEEISDFQKRGRSSRE
jgi:hypothetical protein